MPRQGFEVRNAVVTRARPEFARMKCERRQDREAARASTTDCSGSIRKIQMSAPTKIAKPAYTIDSRADETITPAKALAEGNGP